jgi:hypothetical protein
MSKTKRYISCVKEVMKNMKDLPKGSSAYAICRKSLNYKGTTHNIGLINPIKKIKKQE